MYQKGNNKELEIISLFTENYKQQLYLREISKLSKMPLKTSQNILNKLETARILKSNTHGKNKYFSLNIENVQTKLYLIQTEIYKTSQFLEKYPQFKLFLKEIKTNETIIIFGSFAKETADKNSDIDLLIINKNQKLPSHLLPNKIHPIFLTEDNFIKSLEKQEALTKEVEKNHLILNNYSFYTNALWNYYGNQKNN